MTYQETLDFLFSQLPMYQRIGKAAYKADLSTTIALCNYLENPQLKFKSIHVAGTNGKGSSAHMIASILQEAGYKVGLHTSPHLKDFRERIKINGAMIDEDYVTEFIKSHKTWILDNQPSFFEMTVGMAFQYFADQQVDVAVLEVGMGGRLDSTNVVIPEACLITNIGLDHTQFLGDTLGEIAFEKAGIIKPEIPVVISEYQPEIADVFINTAGKNKAPILFAPKQEHEKHNMDLLGTYQQKNMNGVLSVISIVKDQFKITKDNIVNGLNNIVSNTGLRGRYEVLQDNEPRVICDTAHNIEGVALVMKQVMAETFDRLHIVWGMVDDKNHEDVIKLLPKDPYYYLCQAKIPRALPIENLADLMDNAGLSFDVFDSVSGAMIDAVATANPNDLVFIGGSTFVVAEAI